MSHMGIPVKVMYESVGLVVSLETRKGQFIRGKLIDVEDNMNCQIENCTTTNKEGKTYNMDYVYIRGSSILFMILPDMLKNAPMFTKLRAIKKVPASGGGRGRGRGRGESVRSSFPRPIHVAFVAR